MGRADFREIPNPQAPGGAHLDRSIRETTKENPMRRIIIAGLAGAALVLSACGGGGSSGDAQKVCDELAAGTAPFDVWQSMRDAYPTQGDWAAAAKEWTSSTCPDQLANNEQLRNVLSNNGIDPDS